MPKTKYTDSNFDIDLDFGKIGEDEVLSIFEGDGSIEVKTERDTWKRTGNIAIELSYRGNPSGLTTTDARTWIHLLSYNGHIEGGFILNVKTFRKRIKKLLKSNKARKVYGGDYDLSELVLVPIKYIFKTY
jgi:hypothetical protein